MKVFFKIKFLSLFIIFFLIVNTFSSILTNIKGSNIIGLSITEQFFSVKAFSDNIVKKMLSNKFQTNKQHKKENNDKVYEFLVPSVILSTALNLNLSVNMGVFLGICKQIYLNREIEYPLKIPFWQIIFLLLILKILFYVLPRSISINYNKINIEGACIV